MARGLQNPLARDVEVGMRKLEERDGTTFKTIGSAYDAIRKSNSSLGRRKKRQLEDAIEEVLRFRKAQEDSEDSEAAIDDTPPPRDERFLLNRQMTKLWRDEEPKATANGAEAPPPAKKRRIQDDEAKRKEDKESGADGAQTTEKADKAQPKKAPKTPRYDVQSVHEGPRLGGIDEILTQLLKIVPEMNRNKPPGLPGGRQTPGLVLSGPRGIGKRSLVKKLAAELDVPLISIDACFDDLDRMDKSLNEAVEEALRLAPSFLYIEDLDWCMPKPGGTGHASEGSRRAIRSLRKQMKRIEEQQDPDSPVKAIATTSTLLDVDPTVLSHGLFEETVQIRVPDLKAREDMLRVLTTDSCLDEDVSMLDLAKKTHGFVAGDLVRLFTKTRREVKWRLTESQAVSNSIDSEAIVDSTLPGAAPAYSITTEDFDYVLKSFVPSLRQEGFTAIPNVIWDQVGALSNVRQKLHTSIIGPIKNPDFYSSFGLAPSAGVLLWGPPGCGKTLVAQAVANEAQASFILINGPELLNKYVGESERGVRDLFQRARSSTPCILFFDEIDSIVPRRDGAGTEASTRVVNTLLTELDGVGDRSGIFVIGTTNRPDMIDEAMLRPGRLNERLLVDLPTEDERVDILRAIYRTKHSGASEEELTSMDRIARDKRCTNFSGADLSGLHISAAKHAVERVFAAGIPIAGDGASKKISAEDWEYALANTVASVPRPELYRTL
ncbi:AAA-domain-containing protein [Sarocladium strictum]